MAAFSDIHIEDFMSTKPIHINEDDTLRFVMNIFERTHISGAPVINAAGEYVGVLSKTDLVGSKMLKLIHQLDSATARDVMKPGQPLTIAQTAPLAQAVDLMLEKQVHRLFVTDKEGNITGVVSTFDIMRAIKFAAQEASEQLEATATPPPAGKKTKQADKAGKAERLEKEKEIEKRIFSLITQKQGEIAGSR